MFNPFAIIQGILGTLFNIWVNIWVIGFLLIGLIGITWGEIIFGIVLAAGLFYAFVKLVEDPS
ncbi:uncharacterized protein METZ01_LOCUS467982 [marine metagenome]|uniref:Uncharacterized protein n=1 Tax=marine metagenome TaxID=408172 RepID=A0A383B6X3_9ZZZZ